jgi:hypothetical protein
MDLFFFKKKTTYGSNFGCKEGAFLCCKKQQDKTLCDKVINAYLPLGVAGI